MATAGAQQGGRSLESGAGGLDDESATTVAAEPDPLWARVLIDLPSRVGWWALVTVVVACLTTLADAFSPWIVVPLIAVGIAATWRIPPALPTRNQGALIGSAVAIAAVAVWAAANVFFTSETLYIQRDPGFLALQGVWASQAADPAIPVRSALEVANSVPQATAAGPAFELVGDALYAQGSKSLPAVLGMFGWVGGVSGVLIGNVILGAAAILAFYDCARRLIGSVAGLLPMAILALSMPFVYFTRTPFTEPVNLALLVAGVSMLWAAIREPAMARFAAAGTLIGATALNRIDGAAAVIGLLLGMAVVILINDDEHRRAALGRGLVASGTAAVAMVLLGYIDLRLQSPIYLSDLQSQYRQLVAALVASGIIAAVAYALSRSAALRRWLQQHRRRLASVLAGASAIVVLFLLSRPLWMTANHIEADSPYAGLVGGLQAAEGLDVDPTRSYDEMTLNWIAWYVGWITVVLGLVGLVLMLYRSVRDANLVHLALLVVLSVPSLLYIWRVSITPDQIWAMRRLLSAAIPLLLLLAAWLIARAARARGFWPIGAVAVGLAMLVSPISTWKTIVGVTDKGGTYLEVAAMCDGIGDSRVVSVRPGGHSFLPTTRVVCGADTVEINAAATTEALAAIAALWGDAPVTVVTRYPDAVPWSQPPTPYRVSAITRWPEVLSAPPAAAVVSQSELWLGRLEADGSVSPLEAPPPG